MHVLYLHSGCEALVMGTVPIDRNVLHKNASQSLGGRYGPCRGDCKRGLQRPLQGCQSVIAHAVWRLVQEMQASLQPPSNLLQARDGSWWKSMNERNHGKHK